MKCVMCEGMLQGETVEHTEFGISLGKFKASKCAKCGEIFFDSKTVDKIQAKSKELGLFGLASKKSKIAKVGNSLAVRIPKEIAEFTKLKKEKEIRIIPKSQKEIIIEL